MITLYARQQKRHRCIEQSFGLWERERMGWFGRMALKHEKKNKKRWLPNISLGSSTILPLPHSVPQTHQACSSSELWVSHSSAYNAPSLDTYLAPSITFFKSWFHSQFSEASPSLHEPLQHSYPQTPTSPYETCIPTILMKFFFQRRTNPTNFSYSALLVFSTYHL